MSKQVNREQWLQHAAQVIRADLSSVVTIPQVKISCSWPGGGSARKRIGECWSRSASKAGINEIFISPKIADSAKAISILAHELAHAVDDCKNQHKAPFKAIGTLMGLVGKPTQMEPTPEQAKKWADKVIAKHGEYPHSVLDKSKAPTKTQTTRLLKVECGECGAIWRMSLKVVASAIDGRMSCPCCHSNANVSVEGVAQTDEQ